MKKPVLLFMTNMPTPYQLDFFDELVRHFDLHVCYFSDKEADRQWVLPTMSDTYRVTLLKSYSYARKLQNYIPSFHHSSKIADFIRDTYFDMALINGTYWVPNVRIALREADRKGVKVTFWGESLLPSGKWVSFLKKMAFGVVRNHTDFLLAIGKQAVISYRALGYDKPIHNVPYNINGELFKKQNLVHSELERIKEIYRHNVDCVFLTSGSLIHRKGIDTVIKAFKAVTPGIRARLVVIGDGSERESLVNQAGDADIVFAGFQDKRVVPYIFAASDVFVFATRYDGWALVINEAIESGLPVIGSSRAGAVQELLVHNVSGFVCDPEDVDCFRVRMKELAGNAEKRERMASAARKAVAAVSSRMIAEKLYGIFKLA